MQAIICTKYGPPSNLIVGDIAKPTPKDTEVLVQVHNSMATTADSMMRRADPWIARLFLGFRRPRARVIGTAFSGTIVAVGKYVHQFAIGDQVCGEAGLNFGANAEYVTVDAEGAIIHKPENIDFEQAVTLSDGPMTSLNFLRNIAELQAGQSILIIGASGSLGSAAIQIAKKMGSNVTALGSTDNLDLLRDLGADHVIDRTTQDVTKMNRKFDVIYDTVGKSSFGACKPILAPTGRYVCPVLGCELLFQMLFTRKSKRKRALFSATGMLPPAQLRPMLTDLMHMLKEGDLHSVIDRRYPLGQTAAAHEYVDTGRKTGNVILNMRG